FCSIKNYSINIFTNNYLNKIQHHTCCRTIGFFFLILFFVDRWSGRRRGALKFFGSRIFPYLSLSSEMSTISNISIKLEKLTSTVSSLVSSSAFGVIVDEALAPSVG